MKNRTLTHILSIAKGWFSRRPSPKDIARALYHSIVRQARQPGFYDRCGVPDTVDSRFDMISLHAFLILKRLKREHQMTADVAQAVFDVMFADMDDNLREMGVGDLAVGKRIKEMATAFFGRVAAYNAAFEGGEGAFAAPLRRNLYRNAPVEDSQVALLIGYIMREDAALREQPIERLMAGEAVFGPAPGEIPGEIPGEKNEENPV